MTRMEKYKDLRSGIKKGLNEEQLNLLALLFVEKSLVDVDCESYDKTLEKAIKRFVIALNDLKKANKRLAEDGILEILEKIND